VSLLILLAVVWIAPVSAQTKEASGTVVTVSDSALTVRVDGKEMKFAVDNDTIVGAPGAGRTTRAAQAKGAPGVSLTTLVKTGTGVVVMYRESSGSLLATEIRNVPAASATGTTGTASTPVVSGTVKSVTNTTLVVTESGKDLTFMIDKATRVLAKGAGTATQAAGGTIAFTKLVSVGDQVSVSYEGTGQKMRATEVRMTVDADRAPRPAGR
jgi:predicted ribonuclease toxin of YeeF-YezG toxin-antitoxin module